MALAGSSKREVLCARLAPHLVGLDLEVDLLTFGKTGKPGTLDGADVNEHVLSAVVGLNEAKALLAVEPLNSACRHISSPKHSRVTIHALQIQPVECLWEIARGRIQKGTAANRTGDMYRRCGKIATLSRAAAFKQRRLDIVGGMPG